MNSQYEESMRRMYEARLKEHQRMVYESIYSPSQNQNQVGDGSASGSAGGNPDQDTPFILQAAPFEGGTWNLYRLKTNGEFTLIENAPEFNGPTVFAKNTKDGLTYFVTSNFGTLASSVGVWNQETGEWSYLEESVQVLRNLYPSSLQYVPESEFGGDYFIYTDNSPFYGSDDTIAPITWGIEYDGIGGCQFTEIHEWEVPSESGSATTQIFYELPVAVGASPSPDFYQVRQIGYNGIDPTPWTILSTVDGDTYESTFIDIINIDDHSAIGDGIKIPYILDRTDYEGVTYFNIWVTDKFNATIIGVIAKFNPTEENPARLTTVYQYPINFLEYPYIGLTTI